eukprot:jgi/Psemu1/197686/e_gw1.208.3.1
MGRSSRNSSSNNNNNNNHQKGGTKQKSKAKAPKNSTRNTNGTKSRFPKRSKYSVHNNDVVVYRPIHPPSGSGKPTNYIYGAGTATASSAFHHRHRNHHNGRINNNNFSARKRGKRPFLLRLPVVGPRTPKTVQVPWLRGKDIQNQQQQQQQKQQQQQQQQQSLKPILNGTFSVHESTMDFFRSELEFFSEYVRLSRSEVKAREHLIDRIKRCCKSLFGVDDSDCQVFGSFAAQARSVCVFESDIDLAIWGVVEPDHELEPELEQKPPGGPAAEDEQTEKNRRKQERIRKWKALIDDAAKNNNYVDLLSEREDTNNNNNNDNNNNNNDSPSSSSGEIGAATSNSFAALAENNKIQGQGRAEGEGKTGHDDEEEMLHGFGGIRRRPRGQSLVSLSSSTTCSVEAVAKLDESEMEVSFVVNGGASASANASANASRKQTTDRDKVVGPTGRTRTLVVRSLFRLTKPLRSFSRQIHVRSKARVPIINMITNYGFECDIALGGHNGTDTSSYASTQLSRFKSFSTLVVFLKVLLSQQGLDKPFTGGLGSYALYVMVASHIEQHLELGGEDTPEEVLYTFLFRYGGVPPSHSNHRIDRSLLTPLSQESVIYTSDGGSIDMKPCFQIDNCILVFRECWRILDKKLSRTSDGKFSIVQFLIDAGKLELGRILTKQQADSGAPTGPGTSSSHFRFPERSNSNGNGAMTMAMTMTTFLRDEKKGADSDDEARELIRGYGQNVESFLPVTTATATAAAAAATTESSKRVTATNKKTNKKKRQKTTASYV